MIALGRIARSRGVIARLINATRTNTDIYSLTRDAKTIYALLSRDVTTYDWQQIDAILDKAIDIARPYPEATGTVYRVWGEMHEASGHREEARLCYEKALKANPNVGLKKKVALLREEANLPPLLLPKADPYEVRVTSRSATYQPSPPRPRVLVKHPAGPPLLLRELAGKYKNPIPVTSDTERRVKYLVDIHNLTCTRPDWDDRYAHYPPRDARRIDRYIGRVLVRSQAILEYDQMTQALLGYERDKRIAQGEFFGARCDHIYMMRVSSGMTIALTFSLSSEWINVITKRQKKNDRDDNFSGLYSKYGYSLIEKRWSYQGVPPGHRMLRDEIEGLFRI